MKKLLILLCVTLFSCDPHSDKKNEVCLMLYFTSGHVKKMTIDLPVDAQLFIRPDPAQLVWRSDNVRCGAHVIKYNVIDYEVISINGKKQ